MERPGLSPALRRALNDALTDAFTGPALHRLMTNHFPEALLHIRWEAAAAVIVLDVLSWVESHDRLLEFVQAAREAREHHQQLRLAVEPIRRREQLEPQQAAALAAVERLFRGRVGLRGLAGLVGIDPLLASSALELVEAAIAEHKFVLLVETMAEEEPNDKALQQLLSTSKEETGDETRALLKTYLEWLIQRHDKLLHFHTWAPQDRALEEVFVRVTVAGYVPGEVGWELEGEAHSLIGDVGDRELEDVLNAHAGDRWTLVGNPGAGKTTLLRRIAIRWALAALEALAAGEAPVVPVYLDLVRWAPGVDLPESVEIEVRSERPLEGLAGTLRGALREGRALLLLDGLDGVEPTQARAMSARVGRLARGWPGTRIVVASRPHGYVRPSPEFGELRLLPLDAAARKALARRWLPPEKAQVLCQRIERDPPLRELAEVPLLMTMICLVEREGGRLTGQRTQVYEEIVKLLLRGKPTSGERVVRRLRHRATARGVLCSLALSLLAGGGVEWDRSRLEMLLLADQRIQLGWRADVGAFLQEIEDVSGLLFAVDIDKRRYRFLHRSLQEYLVACALHEQAVERQAQIELIEGEPARWGEIFSLLAGMLEPTEAVGLLKTLFATWPTIGLRALATCDGLADADVVEVLGVGRPDDTTKADELLAREAFFAGLVGRLRAGESSPEIDARAVRLLERLLPGAPALDLAFIWRSLEQFDHPDARALLDRERFFAVAGRPLEPIELSWAALPGGSFRMGSPLSEPGRRADEGPQQEVEISRAFSALKGPVTNALYRRFAPEHPTSGQPGTWPVTNITWYEAMIFAVWAGGRLPTEAEWEYMCRAGTTTPYWSGEREHAMSRAGWSVQNSGRSVHPIGEKPANPWGLFDTHGNVREWCLDWYAPGYPARAIDPSGPASGSARVLRGGDALSDAHSARAASRSALPPGARRPTVGFRVVRAPSLPRPSQSPEKPAIRFVFVYRGACLFLLDHRFLLPVPKAPIPIRLPAPQPLDISQEPLTAQPSPAPEEPSPAPPQRPDTEPTPTPADPITLAKEAESAYLRGRFRDASARAQRLRDLAPTSADVHLSEALIAICGLEQGHTQTAERSLKASLRGADEPLLRALLAALLLEIQEAEGSAPSAPQDLALPAPLPALLAARRALRALNRGAPERALALLDASPPGPEAPGYVRAFWLHSRARVQLDNGALGEAAALYERARQAWREAGSRACEALAAAGLGLVAWQAGALVDAERWLRQAEVLADGAPWTRELLEALLRAASGEEIEAVPTRLDAARFQRALERGHLTSAGVAGWLSAPPIDAPEARDALRESLTALGAPAALGDALWSLRPSLDERDLPEE